MLTLGELAVHMRLAEARCKAGQLTHECLKTLDRVADDARDMIGTERPEWQALADSTVEQKTRLGYTGQVSGTDPLLRSGELRGSIEAAADRRGNLIEGVVASNSAVAAVQEMGSSRIPPRPFLASAMIQSQHLFEETLGQFAVKLLNPSAKYIE